MASIKISNLQPAGSDFFNDSESFMSELTDSEIVNTQGGLNITITTTVGPITIMTIPICFPVTNPMPIIMQP